MVHQHPIAAKIEALKSGQLITVEYWDHYSAIEETDPAQLNTASGYYAGIKQHKHPLLKLAMHLDLSFPFTFILVTDIESIKTQKKAKRLEHP